MASSATPRRCRLAGWIRPWSIVLCTLFPGSAATAAEWLTQEERLAIELACRSAAASGSATGQACRDRQYAEAGSIPRPPGLSFLTVDERMRLAGLCGQAQALGIAPFRRCQTTELNRLAAMLAVPPPEPLPTAAPLAAPVERPPAPARKVVASPPAEAASPPPPASRRLMEVQQRLVDAGYLQGPPNGRYGPATARAIRTFQTDWKLEVTGRVTPELITRLEKLDEADAAVEAVPAPPAPVSKRKAEPPARAEIPPKPPLKTDPPTRPPMPVRKAAPKPPSEDIIAEEDGPTPQRPSPMNGLVPVDPGGNGSRSFGSPHDDLRPDQVYTQVKGAVWQVVAAKDYIALKNGERVGGSAVAVRSGRLLTNCHVVADAGIIIVYQGQIWHPARVIAANWDKDRCVLASDVPIGGTKARIRAYKDLRVGEKVIAIGNPLGLEQTLSEGIISGLRTMDGVAYVQTSAAISHGSSGGGLFDANGNLIGITTLYLNDAQQLNFAIAADSYGVK